MFERIPDVGQGQESKSALAVAWSQGARFIIHCNKCGAGSIGDKRKGHWEQDCPEKDSNEKAAL